MSFIKILRHTMKYTTTKEAVKSKPAERRGRKAVSPVQDSLVAKTLKSNIDLLKRKGIRNEKTYYLFISYSYGCYAGCPGFCRLS